MTWAQRKRLEFIADRLGREGYINRADLCGEFGISFQSAAATFRLFEAERPGEMTYDTHLKCYVPTKKEAANG